MSILVTGARGYVGSLVSAQLAALGADIIEVDLGWFAHACVQPESDRSKHTDSVRDLRDVQVEELRGLDAVIHLAAYSNDPMGWLSPQSTYELNQNATLILAEKAKLAGVRRFVFSSTCSVYGESGAVEVNEDDAAKPLTPYAAAKLAAEKALLDLRDRTFDVVILRGATAFGGSPVPRTDLLLNELCALAACGQPIELLSDGQSWRPFMPVDDFARALVHVALNGTHVAGVAPVFNIAPPSMQMTVKDAADRAAAIGGIGDPIMGSKNQPDRRSYRVNGSRFLSCYPGFAYSEDFEGEVRKTIAAFSKIQTLAHDLERDRFVRLAMLKNAVVNSHA